MGAMMAHTLALLLVCAGTSTAQQTTVDVVQGRLQGVLAPDGLTVAFKGIPYAAPPLGDLRFRSPQTPAAWSGVRDASAFKHNCMQGSMNMGWPQPLSTQSEDCLYLNVYAPAVKPQKPVPVLFWIFGGGFQGGGGNETRLNGTWDVALTKGEVC